MVSKQNYSLQIEVNQSSYLGLLDGKMHYYWSYLVVEGSVLQTVGGQESIGRVTLHAYTVLLVFTEYFLLMAVRDGIFDYTMDI